MTGLVRSELVKLLSTRGVYGLVAGAWVVAALATWSTISQVGAANVSGRLAEQPFFVITVVNLTVFAAVLGARGATEEFRYGTVIATVLATRRRDLVLVAKAAVAALAGVVMGVSALAVMTGTAVLMAGSGAAFTVTGQDMERMAGAAAATGVWALLGTAVGVAVRHQVAAVVGVIVWLLVVENLGAGLLGGAGRYLPGQAAYALGGGPDLLALPGAAALLLAYTAAVLGVARASLTSRDL